MSRTRYHLYLDESGTHDLRLVETGYPVFVLAGCLVGEQYYIKTLVPRVKAMKASFGIERDVPLHSRDIRRQEGPFRFLADSKRRAIFYESLNALFVESRIRLFAVVIRKAEFGRRFLTPPNPYDVSLSLLMSSVCGPPGLPGRNRPIVNRIIAERRGVREDGELQVQFQHYRKSGLFGFGAIDVMNRRPQTVERLFPDRIEFVAKSKAVAGLELADLAAYPIGHAYARNDFAHPSFQIVARKIKQIVPFP